MRRILPLSGILCCSLYTCFDFWILNRSLLDLADYAADIVPDSTCLTCLDRAQHRYMFSIRRVALYAFPLYKETRPNYSQLLGEHVVDSSVYSQASLPVPSLSSALRQDMYSLLLPGFEAFEVQKVQTRITSSASATHPRRALPGPACFHSASCILADIAEQRSPALPTVVTS